MSDDGLKGKVLQYLLEMIQKYPTNTHGFPKEAIANYMTRAMGAKKDRHLYASIVLSIDYLKDEGYLEATIRNEVTFLRLSSKAQDKIFSPSVYASNSRSGGVKVLSNSGVIVFGNSYGTISVDNRAEINNVLQGLADAISNDSAVDEILKADLIQTVNTIKSQIARPSPDKGILKIAWKSLQAAATISGAVQFVDQLKPMIEGVIS